MQINVHRPAVKTVRTLEQGTDGEFHTVELTDHSGGLLVVFIRPDWSDWDKIVSAVEEYRQESAGLAA